MKNHSLQSQFFKSIAERGFEPPKSAIIDGKFHRFSTNHASSDTAGWYVLNQDGDIVYGGFGDHRSDLKVGWSSKDETRMSLSERKKYDAEKIRIFEKAKSEKEKINLDAAKNAERIWNEATQANSEHPYLKRKAVKAYGLKQSQRDGFDVLIVPLKDIHKKIWSLQWIYPDQRKLDKIFMKNGRISGLFFTIGDPTYERVVCEGYATGASIHEATGYCVHVAFNAGNLISVAKTIRQQHNESKIFIAADDDYRTEGNPGLTKAKEASELVEGVLVVPIWTTDTRGDKDTDFNDLANSEGLQVVRQSFEKAASVEVAKESLEENDSEEKSSIATKLVSLTQNITELFSDTNGDAYARIPFNDHHEVYRLNSKNFAEWLNRTFFLKEKTIPNESAMKSAIGTLSGFAKYDNEEKEVFLRIGQAGENIYFDLVDDKWRCIEINSKGWKLLSNPPVTFFRTETLREIPEPKTPGDINLLWNHVNIKEEDRLLLLSWLVKCFRRNASDPLLELTGEQGSGKSITHSFIRDLIDPNKVNLRTAPENTENLFVSAMHSLIFSIENASILKDQLQDGLCILATGGGYAKRTLWTSTDETAVNLRRPVMINGINPVVSRPDLLDRSLCLDIPQLKKRKTDESLVEDFNKDRPQILAGLMDLLSNVLQRLPSIKINPFSLPRMSDFAYCGEAVYQIHGKASGEFLKDFKENRNKGVQRILESSPVGSALISFIDKYPFGHDGTIKELLNKLEEFKSEGERNWVKSAKGLGDVLRRLKPAFRQIEISIEIDPKQKRDGIHVHISRIENSSDEKCELGEHCELVSEKNYSHADIEEF